MRRPGSVLADALVTLVVPNPAGSSNDIIARLVGRELSTRIGQPVIIENRPGADGTIGVRQVVRAAPDGYTLSFGSSTAYAGVPYLYLNPPYDPLKDLARSQSWGAARMSSRCLPRWAKSVTEVVALAKARPGQLNYSSIGEGSIAQLGMADFGERTGIELQHIPYKSTAQSIVDVSTGIIQMQLATVAPTLPMFDAKKIRVLGIAGKNRLSLFQVFPRWRKLGFQGTSIHSGSRCSHPRRRHSQLLRGSIVRSELRLRRQRCDKHSTFRASKPNTAAPRVCNTFCRTIS